MSSDTPQQLKPWGTILLHNDVQRGLESLFASYMRAEPPLEGDALLNVIREDLGPMQLASPNIVSHYDILKRIRIFLETRSVVIPRNPETGSLIGKRVIAAIWNGEEFEEERKRALDYFDAVRKGDVVLYSPVNTPTSPPPVPFRLQDPDAPANAGPALAVPADVPAPAVPQPGAVVRNDPTDDDTYENKRASFFASKYRSRRDKFCGDLEEDWGDHISTFMDFCTDQKLRGNERAQYLHYSLHGDALHFYKTDVRDKIRSWGSIVSAFNDRYSSLTTREDISKKLESLHLSDFMKNEISPREALDSLIKEIDRLSPMSHTEDRTDRRKRKFLSQSCQGIPWARNALSQAESRHFAYRELCSELFSAEFNERKYTEGERRVKMNSESQDTDDVQYRPRLTSKAVNVVVEEPDDREVLFSGPGRFGRTPASSSSFKPADGVRTNRAYQASISRRNSDMPAVLNACWNCQKTNCRLYSCPHPRNEALIKRNRQMAKAWLRQNRAKKVNFVDNSDDSDVARQLVETLLLSGDEADVEDRTSPDEMICDVPTNLSAVHSTLRNRSEHAMEDSSSDEGF